MGGASPARVQATDVPVTCSSNLERLVPHLQPQFNQFKQTDAPPHFLYLSQEARMMTTAMVIALPFTATLSLSFVLAWREAGHTIHSIVSKLNVSSSCSSTKIPATALGLAAKSLLLMVCVNRAGLFASDLNSMKASQRTGGIRTINSYPGLSSIVNLAPGEVVVDRCSVLFRL